MDASHKKMRKIPHPPLGSSQTNQKIKQPNDDGTNIEYGAQSALQDLEVRRFFYR